MLSKVLQLIQTSKYLEESFKSKLVAELLKGRFSACLEDEDMRNNLKHSGLDLFGDRIA